MATSVDSRQPIQTTQSHLDGTSTGYGDVIETRDAGGPGPLGPRNSPSPAPARPRDTIDVPVRAAHPSPDQVIVHDHRRSDDPSKWTAAQWKDAIKQNPEKYVRLLNEMKLDGTLNKDIETSDIQSLQQIGTTALQDNFESRAALSNLQKLLHDMQMNIINNLRA